ncbi:hypothetical protein SDC9_68051 [bioreactor metagenome]|uniref:Uncharacterized protein n=1 Tax=bioreactor metagenome TaxID=1076179 RepID=A0A644Y0E3_9ZZZZ
MIQSGAVFQLHCRPEAFLKAGHALAPFVQNISEVIPVADELFQRLVLPGKIGDIVEAALCLQQGHLAQLI